MDGPDREANTRAAIAYCLAHPRWRLSLQTHKMTRHSLKTQSEPCRPFEISKSARFDAAHYLDQGPADSRYRRLHGHSFEVEATLRGPMQPAAGWVEDLAALDEALKAAALELDHGLLNDKPGLETPDPRAALPLFRRTPEAPLSGSGADRGFAPQHRRALRARNRDRLTL